MAKKRNEGGTLELVLGLTAAAAVLFVYGFLLVAPPAPVVLSVLQ